MRVLFDIAHPAHVHFFRHLYNELASEGHAARVVSRQKDVTTDLLDHYGIPHRQVGAAGKGTLVRAGLELVKRVAALRSEIRSFRPDVVLTRNPAGVQAARLCGVTGIFDTDDGRVAGVHFFAARPFADVITTPAWLPEDYGRRHRRYDSFKPLAYLHPNRFSVDPTVRSRIGVPDGRPLFVVRFSAYAAAHDSSAKGLGSPEKRALVRELARQGTVLVSDEDPLSEEVQRSRIAIPAHDFHHVLGIADLCVGDSQSVTVEAAMLGTPSVRLSSFGRKLACLRILEDKYGLTKNFGPGQEERFMKEVRASLRDLSSLKSRVMMGRSRLLAESVDVTSWYRNLLEQVVTGSLEESRARPARKEVGEQ